MYISKDLKIINERSECSNCICSLGKMKYGSCRQEAENIYSQYFGDIYYRYSSCSIRFLNFIKENKPSAFNKMIKLFKEKELWVHFPDNSENENDYENANLILEILKSDNGALDIE